MTPATPFAADDDDGSPFSYTFLEFGGYTQNLDALSEDADHYQLKGSLALGMFQLVGSYTDSDVDFMSTDASLLSLGVGAHFNMTPKLDLEGDVSWLYNDTSSDIPALDDSGSGWAARFGPRWMPIDWNRGGLELDAELRYIDLDVGFGDTNGERGFVQARGRDAGGGAGANGTPLRSAPGEQPGSPVGGHRSHRSVTRQHYRVAAPRPPSCTPDDGHVADPGEDRRSWTGAGTCT